MKKSRFKREPSYQLAAMQLGNELVLIITVWVILSFSHLAEAELGDATRDPRNPREHSYVIIIGVVVGLFVLFSIVAGGVYLFCYAAPPPPPPRPPPPPPPVAAQGLNPQVIGSFPEVTFPIVGDGGGENGGREDGGREDGYGATECPICLGQFEHGDTLTVLPACRHIFHPGCIGASLTIGTSCPVCRYEYEVPPDDVV